MAKVERAQRAEIRQADSWYFGASSNMARQPPSAHLGKIRQLRVLATADPSRLRTEKPNSDKSKARPPGVPGVIRRCRPDPPRPGRIRRL